MSPALQNRVEQIPTPPAPPTPPTPRAITIDGPNGQQTVINLPTRPLSGSEVRALRRRGSELSNQLQSANGRRDRLARQLEDATGTNRQGIEQRIAQLDQRIMTIEGDIAENGRLLASAPAAALAAAEEAPRIEQNPFGLNPGQITGISIVGTIFVGFPIALALARNIWKRGSRQAAPAASRESVDQMQRLEQAVDAIAIEVERISEGQRYVTRLLSEGTAPALPVGQRAPEPVRLPDRDALRASRGSV